MREVTTEEAAAFAVQNKLFFLETSALDNSDKMIEKVFQTLSEDIIKHKDSAEEGDNEGQAQLGGGKQMELKEVRDSNPKGGDKKKKGGCC